MIETDDAVATTRRSVSPDAASRALNSASVRARATPNIAIRTSDKMCP